MPPFSNGHAETSRWLASSWQAQSVASSWRPTNTRGSKTKPTDAPLNFECSKPDTRSERPTICSLESNVEPKPAMNPKVKSKPTPAPKPPPPDPHEVAAKALTDVIGILEQLNDDDRERVLKSAQAYFSPLAKKEWER